MFSRKIIFSSLFFFILSLLFRLLLSRLVSSLSSSLVSSCLFSLSLSRLLVSSFSVSLCLSLSLSPCDVVCVFVCACVCCGTLKNVEKPVCGFKNASVCTFKTSLCMPAPRVNVFQHVRVVPAYVLNGHTESRAVSSSVLLGSSLGPRGPPNKPMDLTHFQFENKSRATRCRFLQSFAVPDKAIQFQQS